MRRNLTKPANMALLDIIMARLIKLDKFTHPMLGLEIFDGPFSGVTFRFSKFTVGEDEDENGMKPVTYDIDIYEAPEGFEKTPEFEEFCGEVFFAWLTYIAQNDLNPLLQVRTSPTIH